MATDSDEIHERLIESFQPRLRNLIAVHQVLDLLDFITPDQKERIRQKNTNDGNLAAADALISAVIQRPHQAGWFRAFVDALEASGCGYAADYIQNKIPEPAVETENDNCVRLIQLLSPSLDMKVAEVCVHCLSQELITQDDSEIVSISLARTLLYTYIYIVCLHFHSSKTNIVLYHFSILRTYRQCLHS